MNKKVVIVIVVLLLAVGGYFMTQKSSNLSMNSNSAGSNSPFTSIQDALSKSLSLQCTFTDDEGRETKTYIKAGAVRTDFTGTKSAESGGMIMKDRKMYTWNSDSKEGFMMEIPEVSITPSQTEKTTTYTGTGKKSGKDANPADALAMIEKFKDSCKPGTVADSLFTPPTDIKFNDFSNMMKQFTQPTGGAMNEESLKNLMEQYGGQ